jgi:hypothetical protein
MKSVKVGQIVRVPHANTRSGNRVSPVYGDGIVTRTYQAKGGMAAEVTYEYADHRYTRKVLIKNLKPSDNYRELTTEYFELTAPDKNGNYLKD